jgi:hypothetical protein
MPARKKNEANWHKNPIQISFHRLYLLSLHLQNVVAKVTIFFLKHTDIKDEDIHNNNIVGINGCKRRRGFGAGRLD